MLDAMNIIAIGLLDYYIVASRHYCVQIYKVYIINVFEFHNLANASTIKLPLRHKIEAICGRCSWTK